MRILETPSKNISPILWHKVLLIELQIKFDTMVNEHEHEHCCTTQSQTIYQFYNHFTSIRNQALA